MLNWNEDLKASSLLRQYKLWNFPKSSQFIGDSFKMGLKSEMQNLVNELKTILLKKQC